MRKFNRLLQLENEGVSLENKLFNIATFTACLLSLVAVVFNSFLQLDLILNVVILLFGCISALLFYFSRFKHFSEKLIPPFLVAVFGMLIIVWFKNGGVAGSAVLLLIFISALGILILHKKARYILLISIITTTIFLYFIELQYPEMITEYPSDKVRNIDIFFSTIISLSVLGFLLIYFKNAYDREQELLIEHKEVLEQTIHKLAASKETAEKATFAKSYFLANMSHELRTPLNGIIGTAELLKLETLSPQQKELLDTLQSCSDVLLNIINDVLDVSKIEAGQLFLQSSPFTLQKTIKTVLAIANAQMNSLNKQLKLDYYIEEGIADTIVGDENRLKQVLLNLIGNAIKFTEHGAITVAVEKEVVERERQLITFHISDTGIGIEENKISELFEPFKQVQNNYAREYGGTGLGLSICKKIIEMMQGEIWVKSLPGKGSTFSFRIPLQIASQGIPQEKPKSTTPVLAKNNTAILLAEDNTMNQFVAKKLFGSLGYQVDIAETGLQVLSMVAQKKYHLIFMDMQMPVMDGLEATRQIVQQQFLHPPIIIAMTANALNDDEQACKKAGMHDFLAKPFTRDQLKDMLEKWTS